MEATALRSNSDLLTTDHLRDEHTWDPEHALNFEFIGSSSLAIPDP